METNQETGVKHWLAIGLFVVLAIIIFGLLWLFFLSPSNPSGLGWFLFSFAAGLSMIVLPCTLPLAFVIVPLSMGKGVKKGFGIALSFALGITLTLSLYGVIAAIVGRLAIDSLGAPLETVKNWVYFIAGIFALLFALSEIGLLKFKMPSYTGAAPAFIQKQQDFLKAFFLGMFLGNIGVGCPHPATPLILIEIASSGNVLYGWLLFLVHAVGRVLPLIFMAVLGILGVNGLSWLVARKDKVEKATGWAMIFVAGFILTLGLFSHAWWVNSGIHTGLEKITQEGRLLDIVRENLNSTVVHSHGLEVGTGLFGLPLWLGNWFMVFLWIIPIWWWWFRKKRDVKIIPEINTIPQKTAEMQNITNKKYLFIALSALLALIFIYTLPHNFIYHQSQEQSHGHSPDTMEEHHDEMMSDDKMMSDHMDQMMNHSDQKHGVLLHEENEVKEGLVVNFQPEENISTKSTTTLKFFVNILPTKTPVENLEIEHEKYIHVIGVKEDLSNFFHIHPDNLGRGIWSTNFKFEEAGEYKVWSDITYEGKAHSFGSNVINVTSSKTSSAITPKIISIEFIKNIVIDKYQVSVAYPEPIVINRNTSIDFSLKDFTGNGILLEPYLGADMHLAIIKDDLKEYVHTHPESHVDTENHDVPTPSHDNSDGHHGFNNLFAKKVLAHGTAPEDILAEKNISFSVNFSKAGVYKMFAQFRPKNVSLPKDESLVAEFYIKVYDIGPDYPTLKDDDHHAETTQDLPPSKTSLVIISFVLIAILGIASYKFINIKS